MDEWRVLLYYPLGMLPALFFGLRVLVQWLQSERAGTSMVSALFWRLSLAGNLLSVAHYFIQLQFPFALFQTINAVISWRNLDLMRAEGAYVSTRGAIKVFLSCIALLTVCFVTLSLSTEGQIIWTRIPVHAWKTTLHVSLAWHLVGTVGQCLFASRFWVQWWLAEKSHASHLGNAFWWLCIIGNLMSLLYFVRIDDTVSIMNNAFTVIPAIRNLILLARRPTA
ncbi:MAG: lipid-A-disaccharide synthase N-terminal domain-containing protein [Chlamydiales bacterium]|nr:lipid-A-disaccharide synthase N-terminal domain-containing protein [Chlamydiales bacterium]